MPAQQPWMPVGVTVADVMESMDKLSITIEAPSQELADGLIGLAELGGYDKVLLEAIQLGSAVTITTKKGS